MANPDFQADVNALLAHANNACAKYQFTMCFVSSMHYQLLQPTYDVANKWFESTFNFIKE